MPEYIEKGKAIRIVDELQGPRQAYQRIKSLPAADVVPVRHAYWKEIGTDKRGRGGVFVCAGPEGCGKTYPYICDYCPNCGARMDGDPDG